MVTVPRTVAFGVALTLAVAYYAWELWRSRKLLLQWAKRQGVAIIRSRRRWVFKGPFFWKSTSGQMVFRVEVRDPHGRERIGWVLCGNYVTGMTTGETSEIWDEGGAVASGVANGGEVVRVADSPASAPWSPIQQKLIRWAVRSPLRMIFVLVGALLLLLGTVLINYWIRLSPWPNGRSASKEHHFEFVLAYSGAMVLIMFGVAAWSAWRRCRRRD